MRVTIIYIESFSALQRAEIAEMRQLRRVRAQYQRFSALQRAEIAEIRRTALRTGREKYVSVLFNEPKLLKFFERSACGARGAEFQCSSTSRNC